MSWRYINYPIILLLLRSIKVKQVFTVVSNNNCKHKFCGIHTIRVKTCGHLTSRPMSAVGVFHSDLFPLCCCNVRCNHKVLRQFLLQTNGKRHGHLHPSATSRLSWACMRRNIILLTSGPVLHATTCICSFTVLHRELTTIPVSNSNNQQWGPFKWSQAWCSKWHLIYTCMLSQKHM